MSRFRLFFTSVCGVSRSVKDASGRDALGRFCRRDDPKRQFIDGITGGRRRYRQIEVQSQDVLPVGRETCVVTGRALIEMEANNGALLFPIAYTAIHTQEDGQWRLIAWQATRCAIE